MRARAADELEEAVSRLADAWSVVGDRQAPGVRRAGRVMVA